MCLRMWLCRPSWIAQVGPGTRPLHPPHTDPHLHPHTPSEPCSCHEGCSWGPRTRAGLVSSYLDTEAPALGAGGRRRDWLPAGGHAGTTSLGLTSTGCTDPSGTESHSPGLRHACAHSRAAHSCPTPDGTSPPESPPILAPTALRAGGQRAKPRARSGAGPTTDETTSREVSCSVSAGVSLARVGAPNPGLLLPQSRVSRRK